VNVRLYILGVIAAMAIVMSGCDKKDCNGDLDGMWQLTEWRDKNNDVKATKEDMIFYSFQLQMASFRKNGGQIFLRSSLEVNPEQIRLFKFIESTENGHDKIMQSMSDPLIKEVGVPEDGILWIQTLTGGSMVLKTNNQDILSFRKY